MFWRLVLYQLLHLLLFFLILKAPFMPCVNNWVLFHLVSFIVQKFLSFIRSHLFIFVFVSITLGGGS